VTGFKAKFSIASNEPDFDIYAITINGQKQFCYDKVNTTIKIWPIVDPPIVKPSVIEPPPPPPVNKTTKVRLTDRHTERTIIERPTKKPLSTGQSGNRITTTHQPNCPTKNICGSPSPLYKPYATKIAPIQVDDPCLKYNERVREIAPDHPYNDNIRYPYDVTTVKNESYKKKITTCEWICPFPLPPSNLYYSDLLFSEPTRICTPCHKTDRTCYIEYRNY